ncbi:hypothetical protein DSO57_1015170 [Entomophthora muscae]|uniref:Uncharacterized protein n=1 Tax=Entomophthora muscae TaxID=34485 RepID=A0ACC2RJW8_9FUNG|nr:hypothetical protein DSO57_1015170 [Entomophthora muscae]
MVEQANGILVGILKKLAADKPSSWDEYLTCAVMAYRVTSQTVTKESSFKLLYVRQAALPGYLVPIPPKANEVNYSKDVLELTRRIAAL